MTITSQRPISLVITFCNSIILPITDYRGVTPKIIVWLERYLTGLQGCQTMTTIDKILQQFYHFDLVYSIFKFHADLCLWSCIYLQPEEVFSSISISVWLILIKFCELVVAFAFFCNISVKVYIILRHKIFLHIITYIVAVQKIGLLKR